MTIVALLIGLLGAGFTLFACIRLLVALRSRASGDLVLGWFALMLVGSVTTFALLRLL